MARKVLRSAMLLAGVVFAWILAVALAFGAFEHSATADMMVIVTAGATIVLALALAAGLAIIWWRSVGARAGRET